MYGTNRTFINSYMFVLPSGIVFTPGTALSTYVASFLFKTKSILGAVLIPVIVAVVLLYLTFNTLK